MADLFFKFVWFVNNAQRVIIFLIISAIQFKLEAYNKIDLTKRGLMTHPSHSPSLAASAFGDAGAHTKMLKAEKHFMYSPTDGNQKMNAIKIVVCTIKKKYNWYYLNQQYYFNLYAI